VTTELGRAARLLDTIFKLMDDGANTPDIVAELEQSKNLSRKEAIAAVVKGMQMRGIDCYVFEDEDTGETGIGYRSTEEE
jgi:hypothetical protein